MQSPRERKPSLDKKDKEKTPRRTSLEKDNPTSPRRTSLDAKTSPRRTSLDTTKTSHRRTSLDVNKGGDLSPRTSGSFSPRNHPALMSFLNAQFISLNLPQHETFAVKASESGLRTLNWLIEKQVLTCPVCDDSDSNEVVGLVDVIDLCTYAVLKSHKDQSYTQTLESVKVKEVSNYSGQNNLSILPITASFGEVLKTMSRPGIHRVCIKNPKPNVVAQKLGSTSVPWLSKFVTQSLITHFLAENLDVFGNIMDATVAQSGVGTESVYSVTTESTLEDAFRLLVSKKVSGVAVLDSHQHFVGNLDARELSGLLLGSPPVSPKAKVGDHFKAGTDNLVVTSTASIGEVITLLTKTHAHRVYVVDAFSPTSVVGLADVLRYLSKMCPLMLTESDKRTTQAERKVNKAYTYKLSKSYKDLSRNPKEIIALEPHTPAFDAFQIFAAEGVLSFPVVERNKHLKGLVDISDLACFMIEKFEAGNKKPSFDEELKAEMKNTPIVTLMNYSGSNLCCPQSQDVKVRELFQVLCRPGVHRVPLVNQLAEKFRLKYVEGFVTQTDAINFVASHIPFFGYQVLSRKIAAIPEPFGTQLFTVHENDTVLAAFNLLRKEHLDGVPVVDANGSLTATLSFRDFRFMLAVDHQNLHLSTDLLQPLSVFTKKTKKVNEGFTSSGKKVDAFTPAVGVRSHQTILDVVHLFQQHRTHRVYLLDDQTSKPVKTITLGCVLNYLATTLPYLDALTEKERIKRDETIQKQISKHQKDELALSDSN